MQIVGYANEYANEYGCKRNSAFATQECISFSWFHNYFSLIVKKSILSGFIIRMNI